MTVPARLSLVSLGYSGYFADPDGHLREAHNPGWPLDDAGRPLLP